MSMEADARSSREALVDTLATFLATGGALEATARALFVHANTIRYRLRRIADFTGRDPTVPRDGYVLRVVSAGLIGRDRILCAIDPPRGRDRPAPHRS